MKKQRIVVALGGNALGDTPAKQIQAVRKASEAIAGLVEQGHEIILGHGNGPQVGIINSAMSYAAESGPKIPSMPFAECGAMSQGFIGYHLQQALNQELLRHRISRTVVSVVTQVLVDRQDPAFQEYTKPIGRFYTREQAERLTEEYGYRFMEDAGRGYRRVVPSPRPRQIVELPAIRRMVQSGLLVIAVGGGGIPVIEDEDGLKGVDAVIDKDRSCARLALELKADILMILTAVDHVCIRFNRPDQKSLTSLTKEEAEQYLAQGEFGKGSMQPKVEACLDFVSKLPGRMAVITSLENAGIALEDGVGTKIYSNEEKEPASCPEDYVIRLDQTGR